MSTIIDISEHPNERCSEMIEEFLKSNKPSIIADDSKPIGHCAPSPIKTMTSDISRSQEYISGEYI